MGVKTGVSHTPEVITQLVERFDCNRDSCLAGGINEPQVRREDEIRIAKGGQK
jgi:hypothetical protein